ncbi:hypothetical protein ACJJTC_005423 [Scirpophaga incertulas]
MLDLVLSSVKSVKVNIASPLSKVDILHPPLDILLDFPMDSTSASPSASTSASTAASQADSHTAADRLAVLALRGACGAREPAAFSERRLRAHAVATGRAALLRRPFRVLGYAETCGAGWRAACGAACALDAARAAAAARVLAALRWRRVRLPARAPPALRPLRAALLYALLAAGITAGIAPAADGDDDGDGDGDDAAPRPQGIPYLITYTTRLKGMYPPLNTNIKQRNCKSLLIVLK